MPKSFHENFFRANQTRFYTSSPRRARSEYCTSPVVEIQTHRQPQPQPLIRRDHAAPLTASLTARQGVRGPDRAPASGPALSRLNWTGKGVEISSHLEPATRRSLLAGALHHARHRPLATAQPPFLASHGCRPDQTRRRREDRSLSLPTTTISAHSCLPTWPHPPTPGRHPKRPHGRGGLV